jgi:hypothetical protein
MAIDTRTKRTSVLRMSLPWPTGSIPQNERPQIVWQYTGITIALPFPIPTLIRGVRGRLSQSAGLQGRLRRSEGRAGRLVGAGE